MGKLYSLGEWYQLYLTEGTSRALLFVPAPPPRPPGPRPSAVGVSSSIDFTQQSYGGRHFVVGVNVLILLFGDKKVQWIN